MTNTFTFHRQKLRYIEVSTLAWIHTASISVWLTLSLGLGLLLFLCRKAADPSLPPSLPSLAQWISPECLLCTGPCAKHWGYSGEWSKPFPDLIEFPFKCLFRGTEAIRSHQGPDTYLRPHKTSGFSAGQQVPFGGHGADCLGGWGALATRGPWFVNLGLGREELVLEVQQRGLAPFSLYFSRTVHKPQALSLSFCSSPGFDQRGRENQLRSDWQARGERPPEVSESLDYGWPVL